MFRMEMVIPRKRCAVESRIMKAKFHLSKVLPYTVHVYCDNKSHGYHIMQ